MIIPFTLTLKKRGYPRCQHRQLVLVEEGHCLICEDCWTYVDPIQFIEDWARKRRDLRAHQARSERPQQVTELCAGKTNTAARRDALCEYLREVEGCNFLKVIR